MEMLCQGSPPTALASSSDWILLTWHCTSPAKQTRAEVDRSSARPSPEDAWACPHLTHATWSRIAEERLWGRLPPTKHRPDVDESSIDQVVSPSPACCFHGRCFPNSRDRSVSLPLVRPQLILLRLPSAPLGFPENNTCVPNHGRSRIHCQTCRGLPRKPGANADSRAIPRQNADSGLRKNQDSPNPLMHPYTHAYRQSTSSTSPNWSTSLALAPTLVTSQA